MDRLTPIGGANLSPNPVVSLAEVKENLRIQHGEEDRLLQRLIFSALRSLDGPDGVLGRALVRQRWRLERDRFCFSLELPLPPLVSVEAVRYIDPAGVERTIDPADIVVLGTDPGQLRARTIWPAVLDVPGAVAIEFTAGYEDVPEPIRNAVIRAVAGQYANRGDAAGSSAVDLTGLDTYRMWAFG